jgi:hypothetical protein
MRTLALSLLLASCSTLAAGGMWPMNQLPTAALQAHGAPQEPAAFKAWAQRLQGAAVSLPYGSGSFVSAQGLVLTNHHVVSECIAALSSPKRDLLASGFLAAKRSAELRCPGVKAKVLLGIDDLSAHVPVQHGATRRAARSLAEQQCPKGQVCEMVALYGGAQHHRYRYRELKDVRLVMAPEAQAANFGGDDDNFAYPRFAFDFALLRAYEASGKPHQPAHWLRPAQRPAQLGDGIFVLGHPGHTDRLLPVAELQVLRDVELPLQVASLTAQRAELQAYSALSAEAARQAADPLATVENSLKALRGELAALRNPSLMAAKLSTEEKLRQHPDSTPALWQTAEAAMAVQRRLLPGLLAQHAPSGSLLETAIELAAVQAERRLPAPQQLEAYRNGAGLELQAELLTDRPFYAALQSVYLKGHTRHMAQQLGEAHAAVQALRGAPPDLLTQSRMADSRQRAVWLAMAPAAFDAQSDPLLQLGRQLYAIKRPARAEQEVGVKQALLTQAEALAQLRLKALGQTEPPDATSTLRMSFGRVAEVLSGGLRQPWFTTLDGLYARAEGFSHQPPFQLSPRLRSLKGDSTPLNFISTADIIGGNSGSPIVNAAGEWLGVVFDGNLDSLSGRFAFDGTANRATAVDQRAVAWLLRRAFQADSLAKELQLP